MVLGKLPVPGRPTIWTTVGQGPTALEYIQYTIFNIQKKISLNYPRSAAIGYFFSRNSKTSSKQQW